MEWKHKKKFPTHLDKKYPPPDQEKRLLPSPPAYNVKHLKHFPWVSSI